MGSFIYLSFLLAELRSFNCSKKCIICSFLLTSARNLSLLKQFTYMHLKVFITLFQKMIWFIRVWSIKRDADAAEISQNSWTSNPKISETESHSIINNTIFQGCNETFQMYIYKLLQQTQLRSAQNCKIAPFRQFKDHNLKREHDNQKMTPFSSYTFSTLNVCNIHF